MQADAIYEQVWHAQAAGEDTSMVMLPVDDPRIPAAVPMLEPQELSEAAHERRALADRLFDGLVNPEPGVWYGNENVVLSAAWPSSVDEAPGAREAFTEAAGVVQRDGRAALRVGSGRGGVVLRVHGPAWSLVFRVSPVVRPILVCVDGLADHCFWIQETVQERDLVRGSVAQVVEEASRYGWGGDKHVEPASM
ncbi:hypothetical protein [Micromonospora endolithica]|uniref:Uncharacterized protein n=1 Tax=Micromonospora endolithica TaxID=230091 RepID=A0A3A9Z231_9ACTN|nr:hypothetical protein [Micromonospora endolithica]RKN42089.1 hypothetical protein D7223_23400 [Micromonospora endolithica]TWJ26332.1 hypothetical protein JD76_06513 [Micromonospora endolithica]